MITHYLPHCLPWMRSSASGRTSPRSSVPSPGLPNPRLPPWEQATAASAETADLTSTTRPPARDGARPVTVIDMSRKHTRTGPEKAGAMTINTLLTAGRPPACRCAVCDARRAVRLAQALQEKYAPPPEVID
jgi:hypothetical protein